MDSCIGDSRRSAISDFPHLVRMDSVEKFRIPTHMVLCHSITTESWIEDVQFALGVFSRGEPQQVSEGHMMDYLANRYVSAVAPAEFLAVKASCNWWVRNWEVLGDIGLRHSGSNGSGLVNAILFSLHNEIFRDPTPTAWEAVAILPPGTLIIEAQRFVDEVKSSQPAPKE